MGESYSDENTAGAARHQSNAAASDASVALAHALLARLLPDADARLLTAALLAEVAGDSSARDAETTEHGTGEVRTEDEGLAAVAPLDGRARDDVRPATHELARVRRQFALGRTARETRHELNNPLTALLAEAQLFEMEARTEEDRAFARRMVALARRIVALTRRIDARGTGGGLAGAHPDVRQTDGPHPAGRAGHEVRTERGWVARIARIGDTRGVRWSDRVSRPTAEQRCAAIPVTRRLRVREAR